MEYLKETVFYGNSLFKYLICYYENWSFTFTKTIN